MEDGRFIGGRLIEVGLYCSLMLVFKSKKVTLHSLPRHDDSLLFMTQAGVGDGAFGVCSIEGSVIIIIFLHRVAATYAFYGMTLTC